MSRVINVDGPGKQRNHLMRTAAEVLRLISQKSGLDNEARDMVAMLIFCLRGIHAGIDESTLAWEKRDYWVKAEQFRARWAWTDRADQELTAIVSSDSWDELPMALANLFPHFTDIRIAKVTRNPDLWRGAYQRLLREPSERTKV